QRADLLPGVGVYGEGQRQRLPADLSPTGQRSTSGQYAAGGLASYELDLFGRVRSLSDQALQAYLATEEGRRSAHIALVSEVANAYLTWVADHQLLEVAQQTQASRQQTVDLVTHQHRLGVATQLE